VVYIVVVLNNARFSAAVCMCRAIQRGAGVPPQLPANHPLSGVDFGAAYVGESTSDDGMFSTCVAPPRASLGELTMLPQTL